MMGRLYKSLAVVLALVAMEVPALASAEDAHCDDNRDRCDIVIVIPAPDPDPDPQRDPTQQSKKKVVPDCGDVAGGVLGPVGASLADLGQDNAAHAGWVHVTCQSQGDEWWMWLDPGVNAEAIARMLLAQLKLQPPRIGWTPTVPGGMGYVGVPTWLWVADPGRLTWGPASISAGGVSLTARVESMAWSMGNGSSVECATAGTPWRRGMGAGPSPTCGYLYTKQGTYSVTATAHWVARWSGYGRSGAIPLTLSQERTLEIGEIQVIVTKP